MKLLAPPLDLNGIVAVWLESLLYGIYFCLFVQTLRAVLLGNKHRRHAAKIFLWASCILFVACTAHVVVNLYRLIASTLWGAPFFDTRHWGVIFEMTINTITSLVADCLMIYRCFIVWGRSYKVIALPGLLVFGAVALAGAVAQGYTKRPAPAWASVGGDVAYILAFAQNAMTTGLIAWNIWAHERSIGSVLSPSRPSLHGVVRIIVESAAIYLAQLFVLIVLLVLDHPAQYILIQTLVPTVGIVFTLLTLRLAARAAAPPETGTMHTVNFSLPTFSTGADAAATSRVSPVPERRKDGSAAMVECEEFEMDGRGARLRVVDLEEATGYHTAEPGKHHPTTLV